MTSPDVQTFMSMRYFISHWLLCLHNTTLESSSFEGLAVSYGWDKKTQRGLIHKSDMQSKVMMNKCAPNL